MKTISFILLALALAFATPGCATFRDNLASVIETEERKTRPDRVRIVTEEVSVPEEYYNIKACPPPVYLTPQQIAEIESEEDYNRMFVAPLYSNNETCYLSMRRVERFSESLERQ